MKQKGMEMPIQIFIVLFVLLAVAMLVLQMVSQQFQEQQKKMAKEERIRQYAQQLEGMKEKCNSLCATVNAEASLRAKADYCKEKFTEGLDATKDGDTMDYTEDLMIGIGACEDMIYCPHIHECAVGGSSDFTMEKCKEILCNYWDSKNISTARKKELLADFIDPGKCYNNLSAEDKGHHWYTLLFDKDLSGTVDVNEMVCPT